MNKKRQTEDKPNQIKIKIMICDNWSHNINEEEIIYYLKESHDCDH